VSWSFLALIASGAGFPHPIGTSGLHLVAGVALLRPEEAVFAAMLDGWRAQQVARNLALATVESGYG
jgi:hypothetical protein